MTNCTSGDTRLVNGGIGNEGRIEICFDGFWGTICDNGWDNVDAAVACRVLGFDSQGMKLLVQEVNCFQVCLSPS